jgi:ferrous iron transport protein B
VTTGRFGIGTVVAFIIILGFIYMLFRPYDEGSTLKLNTKRLAGAK